MDLVIERDNQMKILIEEVDKFKFLVEERGVQVLQEDNKEEMVQ